MPTLTERRRLRREAPMAYRMHRQERPSLLRAYTWRALQGAARTLPTLDVVGLTCLELPLRHLRRDLDGLTVLHVTDLHLTEGGHPASPTTPPCCSWPTARMSCRAWATIDPASCWPDTRTAASCACRASAPLERSVRCRVAMPWGPTSTTACKRTSAVAWAPAALPCA